MPYISENGQTKFVTQAEFEAFNTAQGIPNPPRRGRSTSDSATAPAGGASANTVAQFFASKDLSTWSTGTAKSLFGQDPVVVPPNADYLISKALPPNIQLGIENNQIKVINSYNRDSQFGSYDLIYVTAKSDDPTIAKTGLATINVLLNRDRA